MIFVGNMKKIEIFVIPVNG